MLVKLAVHAVSSGGGMLTTVSPRVIACVPAGFVNERDKSFPRQLFAFCVDGVASECLLLDTLMTLWHTAGVLELVVCCHTEPHLL